MPDRVQEWRHEQATNEQRILDLQREISGLFERNRELQRFIDDAEANPCQRCDNDGYLAESTLTTPVYCNCTAGVRVCKQDGVIAEGQGVASRPKWQAWQNGRCVTCGLQPNRCECEKP